MYIQKIDSNIAMLICSLKNIKSAESAVRLSALSALISFKETKISSTMYVKMLTSGTHTTNQRDESAKTGILAKHFNLGKHFFVCKWRFKSSHSIVFGLFQLEKVCVTEMWLKNTVSSGKQLEHG